MIGKSIITIILVAAIVGIGYAAHVSAHDNNNNTNQTSAQNLPNNIKNTTTSTPNTTTNNTQNTGSGQDLISAADAQSIAQTYIIQPNAKAGTPILKEIDGEQIYTVPVILNGNNVGEIDIDAQTGKNVGGAGGA